MRILWASNAPWCATGYGVQTKEFIWKIKKLGHEVFCLAFYGLEGSPQEIDGIVFFPKVQADFGASNLANVAQYVNADIVITLVDAWVYPPEVTNSFRWVPWFPIDSYPPAPALLNALKTAYRPVVYSKFARQAMAAMGANYDYIPHGIDTSVFKPMDKREARKAIGCPDGVFVAGIVAANKYNPSRKAFDQQIRAFAKFNRERPDSFLYIHTDPFGVYDGEDIRAILINSGLPQDCYGFPPYFQYMHGMLNDNFMAHAFNAMDVHLNATRGEGFGVTLIQAQACGVPVITTQFTAMPELTKAGWSTAPAELLYMHGTYQAYPSSENIYAALREAYERRDDQELKDLARKSIVEEYDSAFIAENHWKPFLEDIEKRLKR